MSKRRTTIVCTGCSITECGRDREHPTAPDSLGTGYVAMTAAMLRQRLPERELIFINTGISGECAWQTRERWDTDVLSYQPDYVTYMIGGNDAYGLALQPDDPHVQPERYRAILEELADKTLRTSCRQMVFIPQHYLCTKEDEAQNDLPTKGMIHTLPPIVQAMREVAQKYSIPVLDTDRTFLRLLEIYPYTMLSPDRVHPTVYGHTIMALQLTDVLYTLLQRETPACP